jgi:hypothetical protein
MIVVGAANVVVGVSGGTSHASPRPDTTVQMSTVKDADEGAPLSSSAPCDDEDPFHDQDQGGDGTHQHQHQSHQCHFGHCQFISVSANASILLPHLSRAFFNARNIFYTGVDLSTPSRPPSA